MNSINEMMRLIKTSNPAGNYEQYNELENAIKDALIREAKALIEQRGMDSDNGVMILEREKSWIPFFIYEESLLLWRFISKRRATPDAEFGDEGPSFAIDGIECSGGVIYVTDRGERMVSLMDLPIGAIVRLLKHLEQCR